MPTLRFKYGVLNGRLSRGNFAQPFLQPDCLPKGSNESDFTSVCVREIHNGVETQPANMRRWLGRDADWSTAHAFRQFSVVQLNPDFHQAITSAVVNGGDRPSTLLIRYPLHVDTFDKISHQLLLLGRGQFGQKVLESLKVPPDTFLFQDHRIRRGQLLPESFLLNQDTPTLVAQVCGAAHECVPKDIDAALGNRIGAVAELLVYRRKRLFFLGQFRLR